MERLWRPLRDGVQKIKVDRKLASRLPIKRMLRLG
jgi:hypothetical protein